MYGSQSGSVARRIIVIKMVIMAIMVIMVIMVIMILMIIIMVIVDIKGDTNNDSSSNNKGYRIEKVTVE